MSVVSEFDRYIFENPRNVEEDAEVFEAFATLVESVLPIRIEFMPDDVSEVQIERVIDDETAVTLIAYKGNGSDKPPVYTVVLDEEILWPNGDEELCYDRRCEVQVNMHSKTLALLSDLKCEYDMTGDLIRTSGNEKQYLDSHTLFTLATKLEQLPSIFTPITDN